eukprot:m.184679 g.184679  ORF g.184679 m.184679 type:complete len:139 (-) comp53527_c0_seq8:214-630(-)
MQPARSASHSSSSLSARVVPWNGTLPLSSTASRAGQYIVSSEQVPLAYLQHPAPSYTGPAEPKEKFGAAVARGSPPAYWTSRLDEIHPVNQPLGLERSLSRTVGNQSSPDQESLSSECSLEASEALFHPEEYADAAFV